MKLIKKITCLLIAMSMFLISCKSSENKDQSKDRHGKKPQEAISYERAKELQQTYIQNKVVPQIEEAKKLGVEYQPDVRDVTFNLKALKAYIAYVEKESKKKGLKKSDLGIRVYLGMYPENSPKGLEAGDITMFFMPVKLTPETRHKFGGSLMDAILKFRQDDNDVIEGVDGFNYGHSGKPPKDLD